MLRQAEVDAEEERLREAAASLPDETRKTFYHEVRRQVRDPDTYAALNWLFLAGIHHFYLGRWLRGALNLTVFVVGVVLIIAGQPMVGVGLILLISAAELWALFRSQIIVQDWNNRIYKRALRRYEAPVD